MPSALEAQRNKNRSLIEEMAQLGCAPQFEAATRVLVQFLIEEVVGGRVGSPEYDAFQLRFERRMTEEFETALPMIRQQAQAAAAEARKAKLQEAILPSGSVVRDLRRSR